MSVLKRYDSFSAAYYSCPSYVLAINISLGNNTIGMPWHDTTVTSKVKKLSEWHSHSTLESIWPMLQSSAGKSFTWKVSPLTQPYIDSQIFHRVQEHG